MIEEIQEHVEGIPWSTAGRFETFEEADGKRKELTADKDLQVKVKWMRKKDDFAVKTRPDPELEAQRLLEEARILKKKRKKKLNKKRRKK